MRVDSTWDWAIPNLKPLMEKAAQEYVDLKIGSETYDELMGRLMAPWKNKEVRSLLQKRFPILGVRDPKVEKQIRKVCTT